MHTLFLSTNIVPAAAPATNTPAGSLATPLTNGVTTTATNLFYIIHKYSNF